MKDREYWIKNLCATASNLANVASDESRHDTIETYVHEVRSAIDQVAAGEAVQEAMPDHCENCRAELPVTTVHLCHACLPSAPREHAEDAPATEPEMQPVVDELRRRMKVSRDYDLASKPALFDIGVMAMSAQSDPYSSAEVYRKALIDICNFALKAQDALAASQAGTAPQHQENQNGKEIEQGRDAVEDDSCGSHRQTGGDVRGVDRQGMDGSQHTRPVQRRHGAGAQSVSDAVGQAGTAPREAKPLSHAFNLMQIRAWVDEGFERMLPHAVPIPNGYAGEAAAMVWSHIQDELRLWAAHGAVPPQEQK